MIKVKKQGVSLVEVLVTLAVAIIVIAIIDQSFYQIREQHLNTMESLDDNTEVIEVDNIFRDLVEGAYISGNAMYSPWKLSTSQVSNLQVNPLDYPIIYAQRAPLISGATITLPSDAQNGTDVLVLQTIDDPQVLTTAIAFGDTSFTRPIAPEAPAITASKFMLLSSESDQNLISAGSDATSNQATVNLVGGSGAISQNFPVGSVLYTQYLFKIVYIRENIDGQGNVDDQLCQLSSDQSGAPVPTVLLDDVSDLQISYRTNAGWQRVAPDDDIRIWHKEIRGLRFGYRLNGENHQTIVSFGGVSSAYT
ncbi:MULTISPECIES: hypothetical protein [unclassified Francisella]|uniref:hypothetical protein n=1 Tax=unclassified Francisella TaxID=2610885 RepID=UPI002E348E99|nr:MULTISPECIES: hypothetical protein [unclassified Francisella]MED7820247.1 hypothetical protein [Francisella sp. 19S2-4]MED7831082.1 hypothetical protein [Francisella sp. 19S2-10]